MARGLSIWLDLVRGFAAVQVFLFHLRGFTDMPAAWWNGFGHEAVVVFFVLSGFVITFATEQRDPTWERYFVSRTTRIFSVAIPALVLTILFDLVGAWLDPALYAPFPLDMVPARLLAALLMLNESYVPVQVFSNTPFWSLAYEFWYYFLFGTLFYFRGRLRWLLFAVCCLVAGPRILLLFPLWLMGSLGYRLGLGLRWREPVAWALFVLPVPVLALYTSSHAVELNEQLLGGLLGRERWRQALHWSRYLMTDLLLGIAITAHFLAARRLAGRLEPLLAIVERPVRLLAAYSFTLYVLHQPALLLMVAIQNALGMEGSRLPGAILGPLLVSALVGQATENQRHRLRPLAHGVCRWLARSGMSLQRAAARAG